MSSLFSATHSSQDMSAMLNHLSSTTAKGHSIDETDQSFYYQKAEFLWKYTIMLNKDLPTMNVSNGVMEVLGIRNNHRQAEVGTYVHVGKLDGNRKPDRISDDIRGDDCAECPAISTMQASREAIGGGTNPTISHEEHIDTILIGMYGLAGILVSRRKYLDDERCHLFTLNWPEKLVTSEHASVLTGMHDLAKILAVQNKDDEAEELLRFTVDLMETRLEQDDPEVMSSMNTLAFLLNRQGQREEAEMTYRKLLRLKNKILMWDDPGTEETLGHLGMLLKTHGKLKEAAELTASYRLPAMIKSIMLSIFARQSDGLHVGLIDDHHDDDDVREFLAAGPLAIDEIKVCTGDDSLAVELLLDPEDLRMTIVVSLRALMGLRQKLQGAIKYCLEYGMGDFQDLGIDTFVCSIDADHAGRIWALPHHLDT